MRLLPLPASLSRRAPHTIAGRRSSSRVLAVGHVHGRERGAPPACRHGREGELLRALAAGHVHCHVRPWCGRSQNCTKLKCVLVGEKKKKRKEVKLKEKRKWKIIFLFILFFCFIISLNFTKLKCSSVG